MIDFESIFRSGNPARDKFLSRLFGIFGEELVRCWCRCSQAPYEDLGRPTVYGPDEARGHTLDFTLRHRETGRIFVAEMKCDLEFQNYRYLHLSDPWQIEHHKKAAFLKFLRISKCPHDYIVKVKGHELRVDGAVLIWGSITPEGRQAAMERYGFADVFLVKEMANDLRGWKPLDWYQKASEKRNWYN